MNYQALKTAYRSTMNEIKTTDPRSTEWDRLWDEIDRLMFEWKMARENDRFVGPSWEQSRENCYSSGRESRPRWPLRPLWQLHASSKSES